MTDNSGKRSIKEEAVYEMSPSLSCEDINIPAPQGGIDLEVVGICGNTKGRSCCMHDCCGDSLSVNELLRLVKCVVTINKEMKEAVKRVRVTADGDGCTIGFLPRVWTNLPIVQENIDIFCIVREIYDESDNRCKSLKSYRNKGMAGVILLSSIPITERQLRTIKTITNSSSKFFYETVVTLCFTNRYCKLWYYHCDKLFTE
jgi:hypothetical protein